MFATITYNIAIYTTNSYGMILVQKLPMFYGQKFVTFGYQLMLTLFVQLMGMGVAGYLRHFSVYPVKALWPTVLPTIAMNRAYDSNPSLTSLTRQVDSPRDSRKHPRMDHVAL
jgi:hypothetical protein